MKYPKIFRGDRVKLCDAEYCCVSGLSPDKRDLLKSPSYSKLEYDVFLINYNPNSAFPKDLTIKNTKLKDYGYIG